MKIFVKIGIEKLSDFTPFFGKLSSIGKYFLGLKDKHFKKHNPLSKIINRNNVKISYSCTNNISRIIYCCNTKLR